MFVFNIVGILFFSFVVELPEKPCVLPEFVDSSHRLHYHLSKRGRTVTDRVVSVLGYACPDITYCSALYPLAALFLHYMPGKWNQTLSKLAPEQLLDLVLH